ncbi:MAG: cytochrome c-type biogenesis protein [Chloroflexota bacterium]
MRLSLKRKLILLSFVLLASFFAVAVAQAQGGGPGNPTDDDVNRVAKNLYCPVCPNTPLDVCETQACQDWRAQIREQLAQGWTDQQIIDFFVAQYGERVLAEPQRKGFTSLVWLLPVIAVLLGLWIVYEILRGWKKQKQTPEPVPVRNADIPQEALDRIELELREME